MVLATDCFEKFLSSAENNSYARNFIAGADTVLRGETKGSTVWWKMGPNGKAVMGQMGINYS